MQLFAGLGDTDYEDILRAIGHVVDAQGLTHVRVFEHDDGLLVQGLHRGRGQNAALYSHLFRDDELRQLLYEAYQRRSHARPAGQTVDVVCEALPMPVGGVRVHPGWTALQLTLRDLGQSAAARIQLHAQWQRIALAGSVSALAPSGDTEVVLRQSVPMLDTVPVDDPAALLLRLRYVDGAGRQFELWCKYRRAQEGWRVATYPKLRVGRHRLRLAQPASDDFQQARAL